MKNDEDIEVLLRGLEREQLARQETEEILDRVTLELYHANQRLSEMVVTDRLTQLYNRHKLDEVLTYHEHLADRYHAKYGVIMIDIDHFKKVNDTYGHLTGDEVLKTLAKILIRYCRKTDVVGRWGGEEFMIIFPNATEQNLLVVANEIKERITGQDFHGIGRVTVSMGVSLSHPKEPSSRVVSRADDALYKAKENGRNQICILMHNE